jgi:hypothetical protein
LHDENEKELHDENKKEIPSLNTFTNVFDPATRDLKDQESRFSLRPIFEK